MGAEGSLAAGAAAAIGGGGASSGSTLMSLFAGTVSIAGALAPIGPGKFAQADNPAVNASTDTNVLMSLCDRLFVTRLFATGHRSANPTRPREDAKPAVYQVGPSFASLNIPLSCARATLFLTHAAAVKKPAVTWTAGQSI